MDGEGRQRPAVCHLPPASQELPQRCSVLPSAQQCVEKYLKALLISGGIAFRKVHDLGELMALLPSRHRSLLDETEQDRLTEYATVTRYPGNYEPITLTEARQAVKVARRVGRGVRRILEEKPLF